MIGVTGLVTIVLIGAVLLSLGKGIVSFGRIFSGENRHAELNCPKCNAVCSANETTCRDCGFEYR